jgi:hypothetical protein
MSREIDLLEPLNSVELPLNMLSRVPGALTDLLSADKLLDALE